MPRSEKFDALLFELGDIARDRLANRPDRPRTMDRVFKAEDMLVSRRGAVEQLEAEMNATDDDFRQFVEALEAERDGLERLVAPWKKLVSSIDAKARDARKRQGKVRAELAQLKLDLGTIEKRRDVLERSSPQSAAAGQEKLKKLRISVLRTQRELEELAAEVEQILTPAPGQQGGEAIIAHRRLLAMDDEVAARKAARDQTIAKLDAAVAQTEDELHAAEDLLERALVALGEEVYGLRVSDPALAALYLRLDKLK